MASRNVVVIMPFGGGDENAQRRSVIDFFRVKHIITELVEVKLGSVFMPADIKLDYEVARAEIAAGDVLRNARKQILSADIVVAILTELNRNVIYELAFRFELKGKCIILIRGNPDELLPIYVKGQGYDDLDADLSSEYRDDLDHFIKHHSLPLHFNGPIPKELAQSITDNDKHLRLFLQDALEQLESNLCGLPGCIDLVPGLDIGHNLREWETFYPYNVVRVGWSKRSKKYGYLESDMIEKPIVYAANRAYLQMFDLGMDPQSVGPDSNMTIETLMERLIEMECCEPKHLQNLMADQGHLFRKVVLELGSARATAPLVFNANHPHADFRERAFLPTLVGLCAPGSPEMLRSHPHYSYFIVVFVEQAIPEVI